VARPAGRQSLVRGPYHAVRIDGGQLFADDGGRTFCLAFLADDGWHVEAGNSGAALVWPAARLSDSGNPDEGLDDPTATQPTPGEI
jgi:hypothetical protein